MHGLYVAGAVYVRADDRARDVGGYLLLLLAHRLQAVHAGLQFQSASDCHHSDHGSRLLLPLRSTARTYDIALNSRVINLNVTKSEREREREVYLPYNQHITYNKYN